MRRKHQHAWFLLAVTSFFILLRVPSLIEPHWYGDEGVYQVIGRALNSGRILYQEIWDNKPPLLYLIYAAVNGDLFLAKLLSLLSGAASVITFFYLSRKLFTAILGVYVSTIAYALLFGAPILEGNIANAENFMLLPITGAALLTYSYVHNNKKRFLVFAGILLSIAFVIKIVAVFDFLAFLLFLFLVKKETSIKFVSGTLLRFFIPFISLFLFFMFYFLIQGALVEFLSSVFLQNVSYVGDQNEFIFPMGRLVLKTALLAFLIGIFLRFYKKIDKVSLFLYIWVGFAVYNAFFSDRPYIHYLLVMLPSFSLLLGHVINNKKARIVSLVVVLGMVYLANNHFSTYKKNIAYYKNFIDVLMDKKSIVEYQAFFDRATPLQYDIANFIKTNVSKNENVFLWSDSPQIYALSNKLPVGKYTVSYHIRFYEHAERVTSQQIEKSKPKFIIQTIDIPLEANILTSYKLRYIMEGIKIYERTI